MYLNHSLQLINILQNELNLLIDIINDNMRGKLPSYIARTNVSRYDFFDPFRFFRRAPRNRSYEDLVFQSWTLRSSRFSLTLKSRNLRYTFIAPCGTFVLNRRTIIYSQPRTPVLRMRIQRYTENLIYMYVIMIKTCE